MSRSERAGIEALNYLHIRINELKKAGKISGNEMKFMQGQVRSAKYHLKIQDNKYGENR